MVSSGHTQADINVLIYRLILTYIQVNFIHVDIKVNSQQRSTRGT